MLRHLVWAATILACVTAIPCEGAPKWPLPQGVRTVEVNGYDMAYRDAGSGPVIVLIHGAMTDYRFWNPQVPDFASRYRVIAVSLRHFYPEKWDGHGSDFSIDQHASDVAALMTHLKLGKVHLLGHSRGGAVAIEVAKKHPEIIRSLILSDASGLEALLPDTAEGRAEASEGKELRRVLAQNLATGDREMAARVYVDTLIAPGTWARRTPEQRQMTFDNLGTGVAPEDRPSTGCMQITRFNFPILLMNGERSPKRYGEMFAAMRRCKEIPAPAIIPNGTHAMNRDNPAGFNSAVLEFLATH